jgi:hypothetical protein
MQLIFELLKIIGAALVITGIVYYWITRAHRLEGKVVNKA